MSLAEVTVAIESGCHVVSLQASLIERVNVIRAIERELAIAFGLPCYLWNLGAGRFQELSPSVSRQGNSDVCGVERSQPLDVLEFLSHQPGSGVYILEDLHPFLDQEADDVPSRMVAGRVVSRLINIASDRSGGSIYLILLGLQNVELPEVIRSLIPEVWYPLPDYQEREAMLRQFLPQIESGVDLEIVPTLAQRAGGLSIEEIKMSLRLAVAKSGGSLASKGVGLLLDFKVERLKQFDLAFTPSPDVSDFGGMDRIRDAIDGVKRDYTQAARRLGIPLPKGWLLVGPPGTGKTLVCQFCAKMLEFPLISVDTGAIAAGGASYLRRLIDRVEASTPAVVYLDEFDKLFPDPGVPADVKQRQVLGFLLTWLQNKVSQTFVIATLNRLDALPPELTRLGRFDEIFYVDFPQAGERKDILHLHLARFDRRYRHGSVLTMKEWRILLSRTVNCTGAELAGMVEKAAKRQFHAGAREIVLGLDELMAAREEITPLYMADTDRLLRMRNAAKRMATSAASVDDSAYAPPPMTLWGNVEGDSSVFSSETDVNAILPEG